MEEPVLMPFQDLPFNGDVHICREFLKLKGKYDIKTAVETGSCLYSTTKWLCDNFDYVHTVEISEHYARFGRRKIEEYKNVNAKIGDSVEFIKNIRYEFDLKDKKQVIFFLDAHWEKNCPLLEELKSISLLSDVILPPVITIHDFFTGDEALGYDTYNFQRFEYQWIEPMIKIIEDKFKCEYEHYYNTEAYGARRGIIYLTPKKDEK